MIIDANSEEELAHYGKMGMKWGVRREARVQALKKVAEGGSSWRDKNRAGVLTKSGAKMILKNDYDLEDSINRYAKGKGSNADADVATMNMPIGLMIAKGSQGAAKEIIARREMSRKILEQAGDKNVNKYMRSKEGRAAIAAGVAQLNGK